MSQRISCVSSISYAKEARRRLRYAAGSGTGARGASGGATKVAKQLRVKQKTLKVKKKQLTTSSWKCQGNVVGPDPYVSPNL